MGSEDELERRDFFISYTGADLPWARWITWELEAAGYSTVFQEWDFQVGANFVLEMHRAAQQTDRTIAVLSPRYLDALYTQPEWAAALVADPTGTRRQLLPVRVEECQPEGLLAGVIYVDLVGLANDDARDQLRDRVAGTLRGRAKPLVAPPAPIQNTAAQFATGRFAAALPSVWNVPYRRNRFLTGRDQALQTLARHLNAGTTMAVTQAIQGTGGIGKTALAVEYAYRYRTDFDTVWWVRAEDPGTLIGDYAGLAQALGLPAATAAEQQTAVTAVHRWLTGNDRWLLVLDNADGPQATTGLQPPLAHLEDLLPQVVRGQLLVTSRDATWEDAAELVELDLLSPQDAIDFLLARTNRRGHEAAGEIAELLGYLPLALEQAGAYVRQAGISLSSYLDRLRQSPAVAISKGPPNQRDPAQTVAAVWQLSLEKVQATSGAVALLETCAFLGPDDVPRELFTQPDNADHAPQDPLLAELLGDPFALDEAVAALRRFGLIKATDDAMMMHRLLQQVIRDRIEPARATSRVGSAVRLLAGTFPREGYRNPRTWELCGRLLAHALVVADYAEQHHAEPGLTGMLLDNAGGYLVGRARYEEARVLLERALALTLDTYGPDHLRTGFRHHNLGFALMRQHQDPVLGHQHLSRALEIYKDNLGADHHNVAMVTAHLGQVHRQLKDLAGAKEQLDTALSMAEAALGPNHLSVSIILNHLGEVLADLGQLDDARRQLERALAIKEGCLAPNDFELASVLTLLGQVEHELGDHNRARQHLQRALTISEAAVGADHLSVAMTLFRLSQVHNHFGDRHGARQHLERALAICQTVVGPDDPRTTRVNDQLAALRASSPNATARYDLPRS